jgi:hypothetical protein
MLDSLIATRINDWQYEQLTSVTDLPRPSISAAGEVGGPPQHPLYSITAPGHMGSTNATGVIGQSRMRAWVTLIESYITRRCLQTPGSQRIFT